MEVQVTSMLLSLLLFAGRVGGFVSHSRLELSSSSFWTPQDITITFDVSSSPQAGDILTVSLPLFTRRIPRSPKATNYSLVFGDVLLAPSITFTGAWIEGEVNILNTSQLVSSTVVLMVLPIARQTTEDDDNINKYNQDDDFVAPIR